jgi:hypothetical protein
MCILKGQKARIGLRQSSDFPLMVLRHKEHLPR